VALWLAHFDFNVNYLFKKKKSMKEETFCELLKKYIIEDYEGFCLVHLPSGKWCALWHEFTHDEEAIEMLFD